MEPAGGASISSPEHAARRAAPGATPDRDRSLSPMAVTTLSAGDAVVPPQLKLLDAILTAGLGGKNDPDMYVAYEDPDAPDHRLKLRMAYESYVKSIDREPAKPDLWEIYEKIRGLLALLHEHAGTFDSDRPKSRTTQDKALTVYRAFCSQTVRLVDLDKVAGNSTEYSLRLLAWAVREEQLNRSIWRFATYKEANAHEDFTPHAQRYLDELAAL